MPYDKCSKEYQDKVNELIELKAKRIQTNNGGQFRSWQKINQNDKKKKNKKVNIDMMNPLDDYMNNGNLLTASHKWLDWSEEEKYELSPPRKFKKKDRLKLPPVHLRSMD